MFSKVCDIDDLAIYKVANQIISTEAPKFNNIFSHLGRFHIMMAFFKAVGKFIDNCGITNIMIDCDLLATGSVNGFISGKHFNRCKRLLPIASIVFQILHFEAFLQDEEIETSDDVLMELQTIQENVGFTELKENGPLSILLE